MMNVNKMIALLVLCTCSHMLTFVSASTSASTPPAAASATAVVTTETNPKSNPVFQLVGYVKDSFVRMKDGTVQLYTNHQRCNEIRSKQKDYLKILQEQSTATSTKLKYKPSLGGITYQEFDFLQRGKEDRGKLANIVFMMVFAPNFVPYAFMFFPEMLPSPFATPQKGGMGGGMGGMGFGASAAAGGGVHNKWDLMSRERSHAVLQAMISMEKAARTPPFLSNLNPFGKNKTKKNMEKMDRFNLVCGALLTADHGVNSSSSNSKTSKNNDNDGSNARNLDAELVMKVLEDEIYTKEEPKKDRTALTIVPKAIIQGLGKALEAPSSSSINSNPLMPNFLIRGRVLNSLSQITDADEFLVNEKVDLDTLSPELLQEACGKRLIGGPGRSVEEMVDGLSVWLDLTVKRPQSIVKSSTTNGSSGGGDSGDGGLYYNGNLARVALLSFNAVDGARDARSSSFLPRLMYQGPLYNAFGVSAKGSDRPYEKDTELPSIVSSAEKEELKSSPKAGRWFKRK